MVEKQPTKVVRDEAYWARLHIRSDKSQPVELRPKLRGDRMRRAGFGTRYERGGFKDD